VEEGGARWSQGKAGSACSVAGHMGNLALQGRWLAYAPPRGGGSTSRLRDRGRVYAKIREASTSSSIDVAATQRMHLNPVQIARQRARDMSTFGLHIIRRRPPAALEHPLAVSHGSPEVSGSGAHSTLGAIAVLRSPPTQPHPYTKVAPE
jgi:hypothetical protein